MPITLVSLNIASPGIGMVENRNKSLSYDLVFLISQSDEMVANVGEDTVASTLHASAVELIENIERVKALLISQSGIPDDRFTSSCLESESRFFELAIAVSTDAEYRSRLSQFLKPEKEVPHQTMPLQINRLLRRQHDVVVAEQYALMERQRLSNRTISNQ